MKLYETISRYLLGVIFLFGAVDGICFLFFDIYLHGEPFGLFLTTLQSTTYFWAFMKLIQLVGALSLLLNYKPALGLILVTPISAVLCLFYIFEAQPFMHIGILIVITSIILFRAYSKSYMPLLQSYS